MCAAAGLNPSLEEALFVRTRGQYQGSNRTFAQCELQHITPQRFINVIKDKYYGADCERPQDHFDEL
jgi:hypothetical protein